MKKTISILLAVIMVLSVLFAVPFSASAQETQTAQTAVESEGYLYELLPDGTAEITESDFYIETANIPSTTAGSTVTSIGEKAFWMCINLTEVIIPDTVTDISKDAFGMCEKLETIIIPESVTSVGPSAFKCTPWLENRRSGCVYINNILYTYQGECAPGTEVIVRDGTTTIAESAFADCRNIVSVIIADTVTTVCEGASANCKDLENVRYSYSATEISDSAFYGCTSLVSFTIPESVEIIGEKAFFGCTEFNRVTIPASVTEIGAQALSYYSNEAGELCKIEDLTICGYIGSEAHKYAKENEINFEYFDDVLIGDADGNGYITIIDATTVQLYIAQSITLDELRLFCADANEDGDVNVMDVTRIQMMIAKLV